MATAFENAGFNTPIIVNTPQVTPTNKVEATQAPSNSINLLEKKDDEFVKQQDMDALKKELKEEILKEIQQENKDIVKKEPEEKEEKKSFVQKVNGFIANVKKSFATIGEYTKGFFKGVGTGAIAGGAGFGIVGLVGHIKNKTPLKKNKAAIALGVVLALGSMVVQLWKAGLNANEKKAAFDHRYMNKPHQ